MSMIYTTKKGFSVYVDKKTIIMCIQKLLFAPFSFTSFTINFSPFSIVLISRLSFVLICPQLRFHVPINVLSKRPVAPIRPIKPYQMQLHLAFTMRSTAQITHRNLVLVVLVVVVYFIFFYFHFFFFGFVFVFDFLTALSALLHPAHNKNR